MSQHLTTPCTAFAGTRRLASGSLIDVALAIKAAETKGVSDPVLTFDDRSGTVIDLDLRGTTAEIVTRLTAQAGGEGPAARPRNRSVADTAPRARGRPKLGVVAREVTLLPRHWEWLGAQPGGASQALRRLVEDARLSDGGQTERRAAHERTYRFLSALAGDLPGFEEAVRALFSGDCDAFGDHMAAWPADVRSHALMLAQARQVEERS